MVGVRRTGFALVWIATIRITFRADRPYANCNSVTYAELSSVRGSGPPPRCSRSRCRSPCSSRQHYCAHDFAVYAYRHAAAQCRDAGGDECRSAPINVVLDLRRRPL
jgi:hypothetical protein